MTLLSLPLSEVQMFSSVSCSQRHLQFMVLPNDSVGSLVLKHLVVLMCGRQTVSCTKGATVSRDYLVSLLNKQVV